MGEVPRLRLLEFTILFTLLPYIHHISNYNFNLLYFTIMLQKGVNVTKCRYMLNDLLRLSN